MIAFLLHVVESCSIRFNLRYGNRLSCLSAGRYGALPIPHSGITEKGTHRRTHALMRIGHSNGHLRFGSSIRGPIPSRPRCAGPSSGEVLSPDGQIVRDSVSRPLTEARATATQISATPARRVISICDLAHHNGIQNLRHVHRSGISVWISMTSEFSLRLVIDRSDK